MMSNITISVEKVDVDDLIREFKVMNVDTFTSYLKEIWRDLAQRSDDKLKGVNKITFTKYYELPGIISERLYAVFDRNTNNYIDVLEFIENMKILFTEGFEKTSKFIFDFYDFDKDGKISKEDIRTVLSYIPLNTRAKVNNKSYSEQKFEGDSYKDRVESQEELHEILEKCFSKTRYLNYQQFLQIIEESCSDIYFFILVFLLEKRPFSKITLGEYEKQKTPTGKEKKSFLKVTGSPQSQTNSPKKLVASPNMMSKFSPSVTLCKSPSLQIKSLDEFSIGLSNCNGLSKYVQNKGKKHNTVKETNKEQLYKNLTTKYAEREMEAKAHQSKVPVNRKIRHNLKNIQNEKNNQLKEIVYNDLPITPAVKQNVKNLNTENAEIEQVAKQIENEYNSNNSDDEMEIVKCEGFLYKLTETKKLKKLWFKLLHKDLYYFKNETEQLHKGMHNLSGVFVKEEKPTLIENYSFYTFSVVYPKKTRYYFVDNESDYRRWISSIKKATGYADLNDIYEVRDKLGNGKFGLVRLGIHKETGKKVAVKIMNKKDMNNQDLELVKTEIEILKICQHPNIIRQYDVFENNDYIYIIMEYCSGSDLFSYIEKRGFKLPESRACQIIHKLCTAMYYAHSYGIAHRDIKPENILMTDNNETADIKLVDFGLSKIIGPTDFCNEPYGTLSYVAPEVLTEKPYTKAVDMWSIGVTTYLLLAGCLPFDDENSEREIARQTIHDPVHWGSIWKRLSPEAKNFVENLLNKDPSKRMDIKQALENPWIQKNNKSSLPEMRRRSKDMQASNFKLYSATDEVLNQS